MNKTTNNGKKPMSEARRRLMRRRRQILIRNICICALLVLILFGLLFGLIKLTKALFSGGEKTEETESLPVVVTTLADESESESQSPEETESVTQKPVGEDDKIIYLTFDDGPGAYTEKLLDILDKYNVKVTFFVTNQFPKYQDMIGEEARRGHVVAVHSYSHDYKKMYTSVKDYYADFEKMQEIIEAQTGKRANLLRFPAGSSNSVSAKYCKGLMTKLTKDVVDKGYEYSDWNVDSRDAAGAKETSKVMQNAINGIKEHKKAIVLQHDIKSYSVDAVEGIIKWGLENGYEFRSMDQSFVTKFRKLHN